MKKIFILAIIIRLVCLYLFRNANNYDLESYNLVGKLTLNKTSIYPNIANLHHPYFPFFLYLEAFAYYFKNNFINPIMIIKSVNLIFDLGILYLVYLLSKKNLKSVFLYAINPVTILITTFHGQFDVIPLFFILLSIYLIKLKNEIASILTFSAAIMIKTWPIIFIFLLFKKLKNKKIISFLLIFPIVSVIIYTIIFKSSFIDIFKTIINYQGLWGIWGIWVFLGKWRLRWQKLSVMIFLICFLFISYRNKKRTVIKKILYLLYIFYIFTPNFSIQYFSWIIPFLIIEKPRKSLLLIVFITLTLFSYYASPGMVIFQEVSQFLTWIIFIYLFMISELPRATD